MRRRSTASVLARSGRGFTLIEAAMTTVIIGVGVLALIEAQQTFMRANDWSTQAATATYLANEVREMTRPLPRHDPVTGLYIDSSGDLRGWGREPGEETVADLDDLDDFDGLMFWPAGTEGAADNDLPGPIDGFGNTIPDISADGTATLDAQGFPLALRGWSQRVEVEKIDPFNTAQVRSPGYFLPAAPPDFDGIAVGHFPLRVTVTSLFQGPDDAQARTMADIVWIVP